MQENKTITITAGTPVQISTIDLIVNDLFIQPNVGGSGNVQVIGGWRGSGSPSAHGATAGQLTAVCASADASNPGGAYWKSASQRDGYGINLKEFWVDGDHTGDTVIVSYDRRV